MPDFWKSSGRHLLKKTGDGWLQVTPDFLRAYFTRPEIHPVEESCEREHALFEALMDDPLREVEAGELDAILDADARENYRIVLGFRDRLVQGGTLEAAYLGMMKQADIQVPPVFIDQMVHLILHNILQNAQDPLQARAGELFFRDQNVNTGDGMLMLADEEIVSMHAETGGLGGLGQLLVESNTPLASIDLDVLDEDNKQIYWDRSDRFDTVLDLRFAQPGLDALARVIEAWIAHFLRVEVRVQPMQSIKDERWSWHVGLDVESSRILNSLYEGRDVVLDEMNRIIALFRLEFRNPSDSRSALRHKPVYLGMAMNGKNRLKMKPQNLLINLPLSRET